MEEIQDTLKNVTLNKAKIEHIEVGIQSVESIARSQAQKLVDLEDRSRRNNVLFFGISEGSNEIEEDLKHNILRDVFDKVGKKRDKIRPVIMMLFDYNEKQPLFRHYKKLKGSD